MGWETPLLGFEGLGYFIGGGLYPRRGGGRRVYIVGGIARATEQLFNSHRRQIKEGIEEVLASYSKVKYKRKQ